MCLTEAAEELTDQQLLRETLKYFIAIERVKACRAKGLSVSLHFDLSVRYHISCRVSA